MPIRRSKASTKVNDSFNLDQYTTAKSIDELFVMPAKEDANIRNIPAAQVIGLLLMSLGNDNWNYFLKTGIDS